MSVAAFLFVVTLTSIVVASNSASSPSCISCPCGSSNQNYTQCIDESLLKDFTCERWLHCQTCKANTTFCITCSPDRLGPSCSKVSGEHIRRKRQDGSNLLNYPRQSGSCPFLERPDSGSIRCSQTGNDRSCTAQCLPGYHFEGEDINEMTLRCNGGIWTPQAFFPPCRSGGQCEVRVTGAGFYNCTIDMDGTHCDITCDGWQQGRFHCYPGRQWDPPLPFCTAPKEQEACRCQNGGVCDANGRCTCPAGRTGTNCENLERQRATCPDPGIPQDGRRLNPDGSDASNPRMFEEGESVIFTCSGDSFALQGTSFITCLADGTWSANRPRCVGSSVVPSNQFCRHPGVDVNGRIQNQGPLTPRLRAQRFPPNTELTFLCNEGYALEGPTVLICEGSGEWSSAPPTCRRLTITPSVAREPPTDTSCRHPGVDVNGRIEHHELLDPRIRGQTFPSSTELTFLCNEGYAPEGPTILSCLRSGEWSSAPPTCRRISTTTTERPTSDGICRHPGVDVNGRIEGDPIDPRQRRRMFPVDTELTFSCNDGFVAEGATVIYCMNNGEWTENPPSCRSSPPATGNPPSELTQLCPDPPTDPEVEVEEFTYLDPRKVQGWEVGQELNFKCREGYDLVGSAITRCLSSGRWSSTPPTCSSRARNPAVSKCPTPVVDPNAIVEEFLQDDQLSKESHERDTELTFRCRDGYVLEGWIKITCNSNGQWSSPSPKCNIRSDANCGISLVSNSDRVTNGNNTLPGEWPWTVAIAAVAWNGYSSIVCGGALLDKRTVLTAAHCLANADSFTLYFGKHNRDVQYDDKEVKVGRSYRVISHPGFDSETYDNDIAIIKFYPEVSYSERIQPICLPTPESTDKNVLPGKKGYVGGWGTNEHQLQSEQLMMAQLPVQSDETCMEAYRKRDVPLRLNAGKFCAGYRQGNINTCRGDSGSPLVFFDSESHQHVIEGIVSFGMTGHCDDPEKYTVFAKVLPFMNWILRNW